MFRREFYLPNPDRLLILRRAQKKCQTLLNWVLFSLHCQRLAKGNKVLKQDFSVFLFSAG